MMPTWLKWLTATSRGSAVAPATSTVSVPVASPRTVIAAEYRPLSKYLDERFADALVLTFAQIEDVLGRQLPDSAKHQSGWWADVDALGTPTGQSKSWRQAGRTATVNLRAGIVRFERAAGEGVPVIIR